MMVRFTICIVIFAILSSLIIADDPCQFKDNSNRTIDLSSVGHTDGTAAFLDIDSSPPTDYTYSYNPCKSFTEGDVCVKVATCQVSKDRAHSFILGMQENVRWQPAAGPGDNPHILYTAPSTNDRTTDVELQCSPDSKTNTLDYLGEPQTNLYKFRLTSKCCCPDVCKSAGPSGGGGGGIGAGALFLIILAGVAVIYLIVFAIYNRARHHHTGADLIAHRTFWVAVPVYAKDGVVYLFRRVRGKGGLEYRSV